MIYFILGLLYPKAMVIILVASVHHIDVLLHDQFSLGAHFQEDINFKDLLSNDYIALLKRELENYSLSIEEEFSRASETRLRQAFLDSS